MGEKSSPAYPALKAALAVHAGDWFTFPQVFSDGVYQGGYEEVLGKLESGVFDALFEEQFDATPATVQRWVDDRPIMIFSLPHCPQRDELRAMLQSRGVPTEKIFMKWDKALPEYQSLKAQLIKMIGRSQFTFPQTFVNSEYQGSFDEVLPNLKLANLMRSLLMHLGFCLLLRKPQVRVSKLLLMRTSEIQGSWSRGMHSGGAHCAQHCQQ